MNKFISYSEAAAKVKDGMTVMIGGFLGHGTPEGIIDELVKSGVKDLTLIVNDSGFPDKGCGKLVSSHQVKKLIVSHIGTNPDSGRKMNNGEMEIEFSPQGTLAERIRCGGSGLGGVLTTVGLGTVIEEGKETIQIDGKDYLLEKPLRADVALIRASTGDEWGNLIYKGTMQNFNPLMAMAADTVIVEADEVVPVGTLSPETIHTPYIFVNYLINPKSEI
ncbi:CoA transferase subunit A [Petrimonas sp.]|uniref:CoA transferase subunit A n=1 Tax=Petrimonas sp. TaxID=2023866 RepID=UPI003F514467